MTVDKLLKGRIKYVHDKHSGKWDFEFIIGVTRGLLSLRTAALTSVRKSLCDLRLKIWPTTLRIRILKAIGQIFSLIVHKVADRSKRCRS